MEQMPFTKENPWRGLSSYKEGDVLYGRDDDIRDLVQCVLRDKYTLLYGKSGIGKSSLLNAAIKPALRRNGYTPIVIRLSHKESDYLKQIHTAIVNTLGAEGVREQFAQTEEKETLYGYLHRQTFWNKDNTRAKLFLLFDQFEEIFTLQTDEKQKKDFFHQLADQCNDIVPEEHFDHEMPAATDMELDSTEFELPDIESVDSVEDNEIRMIFTIREDFLSEFDYYASSIPVLRNNRYYLRPINEEQAAQIIMRPCPGLVDKENAWLIISKVTKRTDFTIDGKPELSVDAAVLSLYLNKLFDARKENSPITADLIETRGGEIIYNFYKDAISTISPQTVDYLEDNLLTGQGRRDNITEFDAKHDGHVTDKELHILIEEKKILRRFNYAGELRIELIHDTLCPVVLQHIEEREKEILKEAETKKLASLKKRNKILVAMVAALLLLGAISVFWGIADRRTEKLNESSRIVFSFQEEADYDYWNTAELLITGVKDGNDTVILGHWKQINKNFRDSTLLICIDSMKCLNAKLTFYPSGTFVDIDTFITTKNLLANSDRNVQLHIRKKQPYEYAGKVVTLIGNSEIPLSNALVVIGDKLARTENDGAFLFHLDDSLKGDDIIFVLKNGISSIEAPAKKYMRNGRFETIHLEMDSTYLMNFEKKCNVLDYMLQKENCEYDSIYGKWKWEYWYREYKKNDGYMICTEDGQKKDELVIVARALYDGDKSKPRPIIGLYYFASEYQKYKALGHPHYAYRIFTGTMDRDDKTNPNLVRHFTFESSNFVNNRQYINGSFISHIYDSFYFEIRNSKGEVTWKLEK